MKNTQEIGRKLMPVEEIPEGGINHAMVKIIADGRNTEEILKLTKEFFGYLLKEESNDDGRVFHPNYISSCRCLDGKRMNEIIEELKERLDI